MPFNKSRVKKILFITLSNIGDVVLTFPVLDILIDVFPQAEISVVVGSRVESLFKNNPRIKSVYVYEKRQSLPKIFQWLQTLRREHFDLVVDLRHTMIPFFLRSRHHTPLVYFKSALRHKKDEHLNRLARVLPFDNALRERRAIAISQSDFDYVRKLLKKDWGEAQYYVVMAPGAANHNKRWSYEKIAQLADYLIETYHVPVVFVGGKEDKEMIALVKTQMKQRASDFSGVLTLVELAALLKGSLFFVGNDSAPMHMASYFDRPVLAFFGPTDPGLYGPWSSQSLYFKKQTSCQACRNSKLPDHTCIDAIELEEVKQAFRIENHQVIFKR